jgi:predicted deacylase
VPKPRNQPIEVAGVYVNPGERRRIEIPVAKLPTGTDLHLPIMVINGAKPGPTVWISAAVHGDEVNGVEIIGRVIEKIETRELGGCLIAVPIVNVFGFNAQSRYLPDRRDLNRSFPGFEQGSVAGRLAWLFMQEVVRKCQYGIDLHTGSNHRTNLPQIRANLHDDETRRLAEAFGAPVIMHAGAIDGSLRKAATVAGIRTIVYEAGEPLRFDDTAIQLGSDGILRMLHELKMRATRPRHKGPHSALVAKTSWVRALNSGILRLDVKLGARVVAGQQLGLVADAFGDAAAPLTATEDALVIGHTNNPLVQQGEAVVHLATMAAEGTESTLPELDPEGRPVTEP